MTRGYHVGTTRTDWAGAQNETETLTREPGPETRGGFPLGEAKRRKRGCVCVEPPGSTLCFPGSRGGDMMTAAVVAGAAVVALVVGLLVGRALQRRRAGQADAAPKGWWSTRGGSPRDARSAPTRRAGPRPRPTGSAGSRPRASPAGDRGPRAAHGVARGHPGAARRQPGGARDPAVAAERETGESRLEAEKLREQARLELEQVAGFDAKAAKEQLLRRVEDEGRRDAMVLLRDLEVKAREEADRPRPAHPDVLHPAPGLRGGHRDHGVGGAFALRRHEGPHHRP